MAHGDIIYDTELKGFMARAGATGVSFALKYSHRRRQRIATIGTYGDGGLTLHKARTQAEVWRGMVRQGVDPRGAQDQEQAPSLAAVADRFMAEHARKALRPSSQAIYRDALKRLILPKLGRSQVDTLKKSDVEKWHAGLADRPGAANNALRVLSRVLSFAADPDRGWLSGNPASGIKQYELQSRQRYLSEGETHRLWQALADLEAEAKLSPFYLAGIRLLILTGARYGEIFRARWEWVDIERAQILFPVLGAKTANRVLRLSSEALGILTNLPRIEGNPFVIAGQNPGRPYVAKSKPWALVLKRAKIEGLRIHDLRHSWASAAVSSGASLLMVGTHLGHTQARTTERYAHLAPDAVREMTDTVAGRIAARARGTRA